MKDIFSHQDYKNYLRETIASRPNKGRGMRLALAKSLSCPVSHVSQVLKGGSHFSMEQAEGVNLFLGHTDVEANFFLLLLQLGRAGTHPLRLRLEAQVQQVLTQRLVLKDRLGVRDSVRPEDQATFYSSWLYGAVHVIVSIEKYQTKEEISRYLKISLKRTADILEFLISIGLIRQRDDGRYVIGTARIHLGADSPIISKFHTNWRMKAVQSLESEQTKEDLHYSSVVTLSESDVTKIKAQLVNYIAEIKTIIRDSKEEAVHCFALDFFRV